MNKQQQLSVTKISLLDLKLLPRILCYSRKSVFEDRANLLVWDKLKKIKNNASHHNTSGGLTLALQKKYPQKPDIWTSTGKKVPAQSKSVTFSWKNSRELKKTKKTARVVVQTRQGLTQNNLIKIVRVIITSSHLVQYHCKLLHIYSCVTANQMTWISSRLESRIKDSQR